MHDFLVCYYILRILSIVFFLSTVVENHIFRVLIGRVCVKQAMLALQAEECWMFQWAHKKELNRIKADMSDAVENLDTRELGFSDAEDEPEEVDFEFNPSGEWLLIFQTHIIHLMYYCQFYRGNWR